MICHQKIIRDKLALGSLINIEADIAQAKIEPISYATAQDIIERYEWLGTMPAVSKYYFGIFFNGCCAGAVVYGNEYTENLGVWNKYGYTGKILALLRGACVHWAHPHSASKLIRGSMAMLPPEYKVVTCTVDRTAGEIGTIYQACGFDYVGVMSKGGKRASIRMDGIAVSGRQAKRLYGTRGINRLAKMGIVAEAVPRKERYFGFRGTQKEQKIFRSAISHLIKPYPKREV